MHDVLEDLAYDDARNRFESRRERMVDEAAKEYHDGNEGVANALMDTARNLQYTGLCWESDNERLLSNPYGFNEDGVPMRKCNCGMLIEEPAPCGSPECYVGTGSD